MFYMVIDVTTVEETKILNIAKVREAQLFGQYYALKGRKVVGPPMAGKSFSQFSFEQLQYLFWNSFKQPPSEDYAELIKNCFKMVGDLPTNGMDIRELEQMVNAVKPEEGEFVEAKKKKKKAAATKREPGARPKAGTTTGAVWDLCDELTAKLGRLPERKEALAFCTEEAGIHKSTVSTQFSKWKKGIQKLEKNS